MGHLTDPIDALPDHTFESILAYLPVLSVRAARCVSKRWQSVATSSTFLALHGVRQEQSESWLYVNGFRYKITDPTSSSAPSIPESSCHPWGAGGLVYVVSETTAQQLEYKLSLLEPLWRTTPALPHPGALFIVAAVKNLPHGAHQVIVAGGVPSETSKEPLSTVALFDSATQSWMSCEDLPREFQRIATSRAVTPVVSNRTLYLFHIYSGMVTSLDVATRRWSAVTTLRPPGMQYCYLATRRGALLLVGVSHQNDRFCFRGWHVATSAMECTGESWPVVCHFENSKTCRNSRNWQAKKPQGEDEHMVEASAVWDPLVAIANLLRRIAVSAGIVEFLETLVEIRQAIS